MNILYIQYGNPWNPYAHGGLSKVNHEIMKRLTPKHKVTVYTGLIAGNSRRQDADSIQYIQKAIGKNKWINRLAFSLNSLFWNVSSYDIIILLWTRYAPIFVSNKTSPEILELHSDFFNTPSKFPLIEPIVKFFTKQKILRSKNIISVSKQIAKNAQEYCHCTKTIHVIYNGVDQEISQYASPPGTGDYLLFIGRLDIKVKGIDTLLQAYQMSNTTLPLVIAGDGDDKAEIEKCIYKKGLNEKVKLVGWVSGERKAKLIGQSVAVCIPSREEGWGLVALEAALAQKPSIASSIGGLTEAIEHEKTGLLIPADDIQALKAAIQRIAEKKDLRKFLGINAQKGARSFTWEKSTQEREVIFLKLTNKT